MGPTWGTYFLRVRGAEGVAVTWGDVLRAFRQLKGPGWHKNHV
jgi:hypothetical protein